MSIRSLLVATLAVFVPAHGEASDDPLAGLTEQPIDIELEGAAVRDVFLLVQDIARVDIVVDDCVGGTLDLKLDRVTVRTLLEAMGAALHLEYRREDDGVIGVGCAAEGEDELSAELWDVEIAEVVAEVMPTAEVSGCDGRRIDLDVSNAARGAVMSGLASELDADLWTQDGRVHLRCR